MPAIKTFTRAARQQEVLVADVAESFTKLEECYTSSFPFVFKCQEPRIRPRNSTPNFILWLSVTYEKASVNLIGVMLSKAGQSGRNSY